MIVTPVSAWPDPTGAGESGDSGHTSSGGDSGNRCRASSSKDIMNRVVQLGREDYRVVMGDLYRLINRYRKCRNLHEWLTGAGGWWTWWRAVGLKTAGEH